MTWKTKSRCASDGRETNAPFSQAVWINRGESDAAFTAQKMALMGFDIIGRVCGGAMCRWRVIYAWHCCLPIQLPAAIHHTARCIAGWLTLTLISGAVKVGQAGPIFLSASLCFNIVCHQAQALECFRVTSGNNKKKYVFLSSQVPNTNICTLVMCAVIYKVTVSKPLIFSVICSCSMSCHPESAKIPPGSGVA